MLKIENATLYILNENGVYSKLCGVKDASIETEDELEYISDVISTINDLERSFECVCSIAEEALFSITGLLDVIIQCCPNRKVIYLATHSRKKRTRKKNIHRAIKILEEMSNA